MYCFAHFQVLRIRISLNPWNPFSTSACLTGESSIWNDNAVLVCEVFSGPLLQRNVAVGYAVFHSSLWLRGIWGMIIWGPQHTDYVLSGITQRPYDLPVKGQKRLIRKCVVWHCVICSASQPETRWQAFQACLISHKAWTHDRYKEQWFHWFHRRAMVCHMLTLSSDDPRLDLKFYSLPLCVRAEEVTAIPVIWCLFTLFSQCFLNPFPKNFIYSLCTVCLPIVQYPVSQCQPFHLWWPEGEFVRKCVCLVQFVCLYLCVWW